MNEVNILLNNEVKVTGHRSQFVGQTGLVRDIMADGRTLEIELAHTSGMIVLLDYTFVSEIQEPYNWPKQSQSLGPTANSVVKDTL